jgi:hypothetical protein
MEVSGRYAVAHKYMGVYLRMCKRIEARMAALVILAAVMLAGCVTAGRPMWQYNPFEKKWEQAEK